MSIDFSGDHVQVCEYCGVDGYYGREIAGTDKWIVYLAPSQRYLATCVVALRRKCRDLSELKTEEWVEFAVVVRVLESTVGDLFGPELFNWSCFKNSAFRSENPDPEVHWHFIPRYSRPVKFGGEVFRDPDFGHIPLPIEFRAPDEVMDELELVMRRAVMERLGDVLGKD